MRRYKEDTSRNFTSWCGFFFLIFKIHFYLNAHKPVTEVVTLVVRTGLSRVERVTSHQGAAACVRAREGAAGSRARLLSGVRSKQAYKSPHWLLPEFACAFAVRLRSSAVRENTRGFVLLSLVSERRLLYSPELQCYHSRETWLVFIILHCLSRASQCQCRGDLINERERDEGTQAIPLSVLICVIHMKESDFALMHSYTHPHQLGVL